jgi:CheY-like chemotaxis protein
VRCRQRHRSEDGQHLRPLGRVAAPDIPRPVPSVAAAVARITAETVDGALLDVNLGRETVYPLADRLRERGVPYVFLTGYGAEILPEHHRDRRVVSKPFDPQQVLKTLMRSMQRQD